MASSKEEVKEIYEEIIEDVIEGVRRLLLTNGVLDESMVQNLKRIWKDKLLKSDSFSNYNDLTKTQPEAAEDAAVIPIQILVSRPTLHVNNIFEIRMPLNEQLREEILNKDIANNSPVKQEDTFPRQLYDQKFMGNMSSVKTDKKNTSKCQKYIKLEQTDGALDSSTDSDSTSEVEENSDKVNVEDDSSLNSDDDISDNNEDLDTENIIVCQYEKIVRRYNKWKFFLKSGIMTLNGKDHIFKWFIGEAEW